MTEDKRLEEIREHLKNGRYIEKYVFDCESDIRDLLSVIDRLKEEIVKEKQAYIGMELGFKEQTKKVKELEERLGRFDNYISLKVERMKELEAENKELKEENYKLEGKRGRLEWENERLDACFDGHQEEIQSLEAENKGLRFSADYRKSSMNGKNYEIVGLEAENKELKEKLNGHTS